jgi:hypothetical protein
MTVGPRVIEFAAVAMDEFMARLGATVGAATLGDDVKDITEVTEVVALLCPLVMLLAPCDNVGADDAL